MLPALGLLPHQVRVLPAEAAALIDAPPADAVLVDGRRDLAGARVAVPAAPHHRPRLSRCCCRHRGRPGRRRRRLGRGRRPARHRRAGRGRGPAPAGDRPDRLRRAARRAAAAEIRAGDVVIDEATYTARVRGRALDLTFKEFELLKFLAQHPGRVFTRAQLLQEVWGYDYFGGTRTVDVHVRRLRAKLGAEHEALIGTVRNVGYRFVPPGRERARGRARPVDA